jgi:CelD/BcsL family acetyltransferase involved in cellulose biosynthesis
VLTTIYKTDPLEDQRWDRFLQQHARASIFHTRGWLEALRRTYAYEVVMYTTCPPHQELSNGLVFCQIKSFLTGSRLVSVPFADHCEPLVDSADDCSEILAFLCSEFSNRTSKYIEMRPRAPDRASKSGFANSKTFYLHVLDLRPEIEQLFRSFHKDCVRRKIQRAEREGLAYEEGRSEALLDEFYSLLLLTRRRHELPPQPRQWFRNLIACLGDEVKIRMAFKHNQPVASILTLRYKDTIVYKYGASDARFHNLGGMAFLFWKAIQEAKKDGLREFDFGRSDCDKPGLIAFKDHWGTTRSALTYLRYPAPHSRSADESHRIRLAMRLFARMPDRILTLTGKLLYKHVG